MPIWLFCFFSEQTILQAVFFEMDRETMPINRILDKFRKYLMLATSNDFWDYFDAPPKILFLTLRKDWAFQVKKQLEKYADDIGYWDALTGNHFLLSWTEDRNQKKDTLGKNWIRADWDNDFRMSFFA